MVYSFMAITVLTSVEQDGRDTFVNTVLFEVPDGFTQKDLLKAIHEAVQEYTQTDQGKHDVVHNCGAFNLGDVVGSLPVEFQKKHQFLIKNCFSSEDVIDGDLNFYSEPNLIGEGCL